MQNIASIYNNKALVLDQVNMAGNGAIDFAHGLPRTDAVNGFVAAGKWGDALNIVGYGKGDSNTRKITFHDQGGSTHQGPVTFDKPITLKSHIQPAYLTWGGWSNTIKLGPDNTAHESINVNAANGNKYLLGFHSNGNVYLWNHGKSTTPLLQISKDSIAINGIGFTNNDIRRLSKIGKNMHLQLKSDPVIPHNDSNWKSGILINDPTQDQFYISGPKFGMAVNNALRAFTGHGGSWRNASINYFKNNV